jgi:hypothetical protein
MKISSIFLFVILFFSANGQSLHFSTNNTALKNSYNLFSNTKKIFYDPSCKCHKKPVKKSSEEKNKKRLQLKKAFGCFSGICISTFLITTAYLRKNKQNSNAQEKAAQEQAAQEQAAQSINNFVGQETKAREILFSSEVDEQKNLLNTMAQANRLSLLKEETQGRNIIFDLEVDSQKNILTAFEKLQRLFLSEKESKMRGLFSQEINELAARNNVLQQEKLIQPWLELNQKKEEAKQEFERFKNKFLVSYRSEESQSKKTPSKTNDFTAFFSDFLARAKVEESGFYNGLVLKTEESLSATQEQEQVRQELDFQDKDKTQPPLGKKSSSQEKLPANTHVDSPDKNRTLQTTLSNAWSEQQRT